MVEKLKQVLNILIAVEEGQETNAEQAIALVLAMPVIAEQVEVKAALRSWYVLVEVDQEAPL